MLDTHRLRVFLVAADTLNFSQAAHRLHMTQPSVSQNIQALEQQCGTPLFVRSGRRLALTEAGTILVPMAEKMISMSVHTLEVMNNLKGEVHGQLIVGCSTTPGKYLLPKLLAKFISQFPQVQATCNVHSRKQALTMLSQGHVHLALASTHEFDKDCEFFRLYEDRIVLIAPLDHPWSERESIEPDELLGQRAILREPFSGTYTTLQQGLEKVGLHIEELSSALTLGNAEAIALAVQEGLGIGFVSEIVVSRLVQGGVKIIPIHELGGHLRHDIYLGRNMLRPATIAQTAFWEFVTNPFHRIPEQIRREIFENELRIPA
ncbi:MAG TPA: LysR family transcriptional regulator [Anaerolineales bacterium]|nr:LysR family transcriptional regulator [Anaerolineales bacterium]